MIRSVSMSPVTGPDRSAPVSRRRGRRRSTGQRPYTSTRAGYSSWRPAHSWGIERVVERRLQEAGFTGLGPWKGLAGERLVAEHLVPGDVVCYGLCEEFVGRFSVVCTLDPLDADALRAILLEAQGSPLAEAKAYYALHGIDLEFDDASDRRDRGAGHLPARRARALRRLLHAVLADVEMPAPGVGRRRRRRRLRGATWTVS